MLQPFLLTHFCRWIDSRGMEFDVQLLTKILFHRLLLSHGMVGDIDRLVDGMISNEESDV